MIDVKGTIAATLKERIDRMRLLADNNPKVFRKILNLIVLDDMYEWSDYLDVPQEILKKIKDYRVNYILSNPEFIMLKIDPTYLDENGDYLVIVPLQPYVNVNTPQNNDTWKRVWDTYEDEKVIIDTKITPSSEHLEPWEIDPSCTPETVYYVNEVDPNTGKVSYGKPNNIVISKLSICEKMNVYINREDNTAWYLDNLTNKWIQLNGSNGLTSELVVQLIKDNRQGVQNKVENNKIVHYLTENSTDDGTMQLVTDKEMEDLL